MFPYYYSSPSDSDYFRAIAEERAAREQYATAHRAQEEARHRAARARAARRAYVSPYSSFVDDDDYNNYDLDMDLDNCAYQPRQRPLSYAGNQLPFQYGLNPYQQRALMEEQRRRELQLLEEQRKKEFLELEREKQRRRLDEERIQRILKEERQQEEQKLLEEDRLRQRKALEDEMSRRDRDRASQQSSMEPFLRALGLMPDTISTAPQANQERPIRQPRSRRNDASKSPVRQFPFGQSSTIPPTPVTTIPISTRKESPAPSTPSTKPSEPTPEQVAAAEKIQELYRAYTSRKLALKSISSIRKRFLAARAAFVLPTTLDYDIPTDRRDHTTVTVGPTVILSLPEAVVSLEGVPKLAYTTTNAPLLAYEEELNRILGALDEIESRGDLGVRAARRELARAVEREAERVERWRAVVWDSRAQCKETVATKPEPSSAPVSTEGADVFSSQQPQQMEVESDVQVEEPSTSDAVAQAQIHLVEDTNTLMEPSPVANAEATMEVEESSPGEVSQPQPSTEPSTSTGAPPSKPSYADVVAHRSVPQIVVEPLSCVDPSPVSAESGSEPIPSEFVVPNANVNDAEEHGQSSTPTLSHSPSEFESMDVEPSEIDTPSLTADTEDLPVDRDIAIAADDEFNALDSDAVLLRQKEPETPLPPTPSHSEMHKDRPLSLVDTNWRELFEYDLF